MSWKDELNHQIAVVEYMRMQHPYCLFRSDLAGIRLGNRNSGMRLRSLASSLNGRDWGKGWPDFFVAEPVKGELDDLTWGIKYCGLFIEFKQKTRGSRGGFLYLNEDKLLSDAHIQEQYGKLKILSNRGYATAFSGNVDVSIDMIDCYLEGNWPYKEPYVGDGSDFLE